MGALSWPFQIAPGRQLLSTPAGSWAEKPGSVLSLATQPAFEPRADSHLWQTSLGMPAGAVCKEGREQLVRVSLGPTLPILDNQGNKRRTYGKTQLLCWGL